MSSIDLVGLGGDNSPPEDGKAYRRVGRNWFLDPIQHDAPADSKKYVRLNGNWVEETSGTGGGIPEAPIDSKLYARSDASWVDLGTIFADVFHNHDLEYLPADYLQEWTEIENIPVDLVHDAPQDDNEFVRKNGAWTPFAGGKITYVTHKDDINQFINGGMYDLPDKEVYYFVGDVELDPVPFNVAGKSIAFVSGSTYTGTMKTDATKLFVSDSETNLHVCHIKIDAQNAELLDIVNTGLSFVEFEGVDIYQAKNLGRIKSVNRFLWDGECFVTFLRDIANGGLRIEGDNDIINVNGNIHHDWNGWLYDISGSCRSFVLDHNDFKFSKLNQRLFSETTNDILPQDSKGGGEVNNCIFRNNPDAPMTEGDFTTLVRRGLCLGGVSTESRQWEFNNNSNIPIQSYTDAQQTAEFTTISESVALTHRDVAEGGSFLIDNTSNDVVITLPDPSSEDMQFGFRKLRFLVDGPWFNPDNQAAIEIENDVFRGGIVDVALTPTIGENRIVVVPYKINTNTGLEAGYGLEWLLPDSVPDNHTLVSMGSRALQPIEYSFDKIRGGFAIEPGMAGMAVFVNESGDGLVANPLPSSSNGNVLVNANASSPTSSSWSFTPYDSWTEITNDFDSADVAIDSGGITINSDAENVVYEVQGSITVASVTAAWPGTLTMVVKLNGVEQNRQAFSLTAAGTTTPKFGGVISSWTAGARLTVEYIFTTVWGSSTGTLNAGADTYLSINATVAGAVSANQAIMQSPASMPPNDGRFYAMQNGVWVDITDQLNP